MTSNGPLRAPDTTSPATDMVPSRPIHASDSGTGVPAEMKVGLSSVMESDAAELFASYRKQAEAERQAIVKRAEEEAAGLLRDAEAQAQAAIATAKQQLEQRAAMLAVDLAEKMVRARLNDGDHRRFSDRFVSDLEGIAGRTNSSSHAPTNKESL